MASHLEKGGKSKELCKGSRGSLLCLYYAFVMDSRWNGLSLSSLLLYPLPILVEYVPCHLYTSLS